MFRFTIRDVLWLMVVVGLTLIWLAEHRQHVATIQELNDVTKAKVHAEFGWQSSVVEHNETLRLIEESGLARVGHSDGTKTLQKTNRSTGGPLTGCSN